MKKKILNFLYHSAIIKKLIPTLVYCLQKELANCQTVLDLGCGADSPVQFCKNVRYKVGVEPFKPYLDQAKKKKIHHHYFNNKIEQLKLPKKSFDAVIIIDVLEHLPKKAGLEILKKTQNWARKKVIVTTPNGFVDQKEIDSNPHQKHLSGWTNKEMNKLGFKGYGLAGIKWLRTERVEDTANSDLTSSIRFQPKFFWFIIASLSQIFTYRFPKLAFEFFCVKRLKNKPTK